MKTHSNVRQQLLSGATSGFASTIVLQPFDLLKTRIQQTSVGYSASPQNSHLRNTSVIITTARNILSTSGPRGLWRGTIPSLLRNVPGIALYMTCLTQFRSILASSPYSSYLHATASSASTTSRGSVLPALSPTGNLLAGALTRVFVGSILNPFTVLKTRYESNMYVYTSLSQALKSLARSGGLFSGVVASSLRDAPAAGLSVLFYEGIKGYGSMVTGPQYSLMVHMISGASAGALSTLLTQPFDVIKTRVQLEPKAHPVAKRAVSAPWQILKSIHASRGFRGYFDGGGLRIGKKVFSSALGWAVYEAGLKILLQRTFTIGNEEP